MYRVWYTWHMDRNQREKFTIDIQPLEGGRLQVTVPEIGATTIIESTLRTDAIDAAHRMIGEYLRQRQLSAAQAAR